MDVRHHIRQRRKLRMKKIRNESLPPQDMQLERKPPQLPYSDDPEEEWKRRRAFLWEQYEKHGEDEDSGSRTGAGRWSWRIKWTVSIVLFFATIGIFRMDTPWARQGQAFVYEAFHEEAPFAAMAAWIRDNIYNEGSFIPVLRPEGGQPKAKDANASSVVRYVVPVKGKVVRPFSPSFEGVLLSVSPGASVKALDTGRVVFSGNRPETGNTVMIQHKDGVFSVYGKLGDVFVRENDWVEIGKPIAAISKGSPEFFFAVKINDRYVDPSEVVKFD